MSKGDKKLVEVQVPTKRIFDEVFDWITSALEEKLRKDGVPEEQIEQIFEEQVEPKILKELTFTRKEGFKAVFQIKEV
jgi:uncharacterized membrane-anchored protein